MAKPKLLPCPFCGKEPYISEPKFLNGSYQIACDEDMNNCQVNPFVDGETYEEAIEFWNKRGKE